VLAALIAVGLLAASGGSRPAGSAEGPAAIALASALCHRWVRNQAGAGTTTDLRRGGRRIDHV